LASCRSDANSGFAATRPSRSGRRRYREGPCCEGRPRTHRCARRRKLARERPSRRLADRPIMIGLTIDAAHYIARTPSATEGKSSMSHSPRDREIYLRWLSPMPPSSCSRGTHHKNLKVLIRGRLQGAGRLLDIATSMSAPNPHTHGIDKNLTPVRRRLVRHHRGDASPGRTARRCRTPRQDDVPVAVLRSRSLTDPPAAVGPVKMNAGLDS